MDNSMIISKLNELKQKIILLDYKQYDKLDAIKTRFTMLTRNIFGDKNPYAEKIRSTLFSPSIAYSGMDPSQYLTSWKSGQAKLSNLVDVLVEELELSIELQKNKSTTNREGKNVFIIHGHNEEMKQSVARFIEKLKLNPIILHEKASKGKTIIEKFSEHSDVSFAIALLSPDDVGYSVKQQPTEAKLRARQNVIFEMGFFIGKLGRQNVVALFDTTENFEIPSDYQGVLFIPYDKQGHWNLDIIRELKEIGISVDANDIV